MSERPVKPVENFTRAFTVTGGFALFWLLVLIWAMGGYGLSLAVAAGIWLALRLWPRD